MSCPTQVLPPSLEPEPVDPEPANHNTSRDAADDDDEDEDEFDAERTVCQSTRSATSSLYKEDLSAHAHTHGELFLGTGGPGGLAEIVEQPPTTTAARRRSSVAAASRPKKGDLVRGEDEKGGSGSSDEDEEAQRPEEWTYPDGGKKAWLTVIGCFLWAGTTMGFGLTWGVFQSYYATTTFPETDESIITLVGGLCAFTMNATCFLGGRLGDRFGYKRMLAIGSLLSFLSFFLMSWGTERLWSVFLLQGFLNGLMLGLCMPIAMSLPSQWFLKRRGLATGIATSGSGLIGGTSSIFVRLLIVRVGPRYTLLIYSFIHGALYVIAYSLVEVREPPKRLKANGKIDRPWLPRGVWHTLRWYSFCLSIFVGVFGFTTPYFFITSYVKDTVPELADSTSLTVSVPLIVMNIVGGLGRIAIGFIADRIGPLNSFFCALLLGGLSQVCVWQFAHSFHSIMAFSVLYGAFGGLFMSLLPVVAASLFGTHGLATIVGFATLCNAPGQFAAGSIGGALREAFDDWRALILFSGLCMTGGAFLILYARFEASRKIFARV